MKKQLIMGTALAGVLAFGAADLYHNSTTQELVSIKGSGENPIADTLSSGTADRSTNTQRVRRIVAAQQNATIPQEAPESLMDDKADFATAAVPPAPAALVLKSSPQQPTLKAEKRQSMARSGIASLGDYAQKPLADNSAAIGTFEEITANPLKKVSDEPISTFSVDVDTAAYAALRRSLNNGYVPQKNAVRIEEMINYFDYDYPLPKEATVPFKPTVAVYDTPWNAHTKLLHIGIKGHDVVPAQKPRSNLVFLLDVSGSMNASDKLPLLKNAFRMLVDTLDDDDTVAIVTYAGRAGTVLEPTKISQKSKIMMALDNLNAGGSTAGQQGIQQAYALAGEHYDEDGVNRVILATDGDFNVGLSSSEALKDFIAKKRDTGIFLSVLGFGQGNYSDKTMQALAQNGNGHAAYIDTLNEARKVLVDEAHSSLFTIAKDVKIQVEFNPEQVSEYRLIGYENRMLKREDFNNDAVDAGDIGSGHSVTAIYEITPKGSAAQMIDDLRYGNKRQAEDADDAIEPKDNGEYAFLKMRYKLPTEDASKLITYPITDDMFKDSLSDDTKFATAVAAFGQLLRADTRIGNYSYDDVITLANSARGEDAFGYRAEFVNLVRMAKSLQHKH